MADSVVGRSRRTWCVILAAFGVLALGCLIGLGCGCGPTPGPVSPTPKAKPASPVAATVKPPATATVKPPATATVKPPATATVKPPATATAPPPVASVLPAGDRAAMLAAFEKKLGRVFGGEQGIQSPLGVRKLMDSWDKSLLALLGPEKFKAYAAKYPVPLEPPAAAEGGKKKKKAKGKTVPRDLRDAVLARLRGAFDLEWGIADADLPKLAEALAQAFQAAKGVPLPADAPPPLPAASPVAGAAGTAPPVMPYGAADGFGSAAVGGTREVRVSTVAQLTAALSQGGGLVVLAPGDYDCAYGVCTVRSNTTLDGGGATLYFPGADHNGRGVEVYGTNVVVRNLHIRNAGDNLGFGSMRFKGTKNVLVEHVSCTGSGDDNWSAAYNCSNVTIRWSMAAGGNRNCFFKYGGANLSIHHSILTRAWIRNPLVSGATATLDFRNNFVSNWKMWGTRVEDGAKGNFVNNTWQEEGWAGGKKDAALYSSAGGVFYSAGNTYVGCSERAGGAGAPVVPAPPISGQTDAATALAAVMDETNGAGCMPRNAIDKAYLTVNRTAPGGDGAVGLVLPEARRNGAGAEQTPTVQPTEPPAGGEEE